MLLLAATGLPGNALGQGLGHWVPEGLLITGFCLLVLWSAWRLWHGAQRPRAGTGPLRYLPLLAIGLGVGVLSGLMGVGGGFLVVPALLWFTPLSVLAATATSMAVVVVVSGGGFLLYLGQAQPRRCCSVPWQSAARSACWSATAWRTAWADRHCNACSRCCW